jgi:NAD(P)-dependent dehydrogenase (short-subunit alcohol dehydrogenase family)
MSTISALRGTAAVLYGRVFVNLPIPTAGKEIKEQVFIVTGSNTGLGYESVKHLSRLGAGKIIMAVRSLSKGEEAKQSILASTRKSEESIEVWALDMDSHDSIKNFAERTSSLPRLDGVLANAGLSTTKFSLSEGLEKTLNVNVVSTFLLYVLLLPKMRESTLATGNPCRFSVPNSALHYMASVDELKSSEPGLFTRMSNPDTTVLANNARYNVSKLLVIYGIREFAARETKKSAKGASTVIVNTPNPSFCKSNLQHEVRGDRGFETFEKVMARTGEEGARTLIHGILGGPETHGHYLNDCHVQT